jgi:acyl-lipid omega-6 desaturase (Delta-12 desaturase)
MRTPKADDQSSPCHGPRGRLDRLVALTQPARGMGDRVSLVRASKRFGVEEPRISWRLLAGTCALTALICAAVAAPLSLLLRLPLAIVLGLLQVRLFAFYHDHFHGALLRGSKLGRAVMTLVGGWLLVVPSVWRETHDYHHQHNSKLAGSSIGSYPLVSLATWSRMSASQRLAYRWTRHPLNILAGYITVFGYGMNIAPFLRAPRRHWAAPLALAMQVAMVVGVWRVLDLATALLLVVLPAFISHALGAYLFYVQHNFPGMRLRSRSDWSHALAALESSSMLDMPAWLHWFTGNIGYHHVHHLNHRIPFYRLPVAMLELEPLRYPPRTSFTVRDIAHCLSLAVWDADRQRMLTQRELAQVAQSV